MISSRIIRIQHILAIFVILSFTCEELWSTSKTGVAAASEKKKKDDVVLSSRVLNMCAKEPAITKPKDKKALKWILSASGEGALLLTTSPQHLAACWILYRDPSSNAKYQSKSRVLQRYTLATLHFSTTKSNTTEWDWKMANDVPGATEKKGHWMTKKHECDWYGVHCDSWNKNVIGLNFGFLALDGLIPRELGLLTTLRDLDLHACDLQGVIPHKMVASLSNLQSLQLHMNGFFGAIHREFNGLTSLKELILFGNYMAGTLPTILGDLKHLEVIDMYANQLTGTIPTILGKLKKLKVLDLHDNNLVGTVPKEVCDLKLQELIVDCLGPKPEVKCSCCTKCCRGLPDPKCVDVATGKETY